MADDFFLLFGEERLYLIIESADLVDIILVQVKHLVEYAMRQLLAFELGIFRLKTQQIL